MYTKHFGLEKLPFENVPDPQFFFDQGDHARIRTRIDESLKAGRGLSVVTGHIGSGKTTISQMIKADFPDSVRLIWMAEPPANSMDLFLFIAQELGLDPATSEKTFLMRDIREALLKINSDGKKCLVIMDEAHHLSDDTINGIRLLNNLEEGAVKLIQILLLGQEELMDIINRLEMEPFKQRIATLEILGKMNADRIRGYISHRIRVAGGEPSMLSDTGWEALLLAFSSGSTPRIINSLCDRSLTVAFEREKTLVDVDDVYEAAQGMGLQKEIFFYKVALKKGKKKEVPAAGGSDSVKMPPADDKVDLHVPGDRSEDHATGKTPGQTVDYPPVGKEFEMGIPSPPAYVKSLKIPVIFLVLSIILLGLSFFYFCDKSGSADPVSCLLELIGF